MAAYARQAKDTELIQWATEIKVRAERQAGVMLAQSAKCGERATREQHSHNGGSSHGTTSLPTLSEIGITKDQSSRWQSLASMTDEHFETAVATAKDTAGQVTTAFMLREAKAAKPTGKPMVGKKAEAMRKELKEAKGKGVSMLCTYARLTLTAIESQEEFTHEERELLGRVAGAIHKLQRSAFA
jgi:hypothetical protein